MCILLYICIHICSTYNTKCTVQCAKSNEKNAEKLHEEE